MSLIDNQLIQQIVDHADEIEELGRIPASLLSDLKSANYFSLLLPSRCGGKQLAYPEFLKLVQAVARADGSSGIDHASWLVGVAPLKENGKTQRDLGPAGSILSGPALRELSDRLGAPG